MKRNKLLHLLNAYLPTDPAETEHKKRMLNFVQNNTDCFERSLATGHMTASAWLLNKDSSQALLMHHAKLNIWVQLGGHCDGESDILAVAIKEAQEESGICHIEPISTDIFDIDIHLIPANPREKEHYHYDVRFLLQVKSDEEIMQNSESNQLRWFGKDEAALPTDSSSVVRMFKKWQELIKI